MLGEKIGEIQCSTTNKALPTDGAMPIFETSAQGGGTLGGVQVQSLATYSSQMREDGTLYGECPAGVVMTADGVATFKATGIGRFTADGGATFRGAVYFQATAPSLASLNGICAVYDWEVDAEGTATWTLWEKK
tara:strand:- start:5925 stop:6326 length:402 start_codon:yes stop_codon:yes gene_type:complete